MKAPGLKVLLVMHKMPFPLHDGGAWSSYHVAMGLAGHDIQLTVLALNTPRHPVDIGACSEEFSENIRFEYATVNTCIKPYKALLNLFSRRSYFVERFSSGDFEDSLKKLLREHDFDVVQLEHSYMGVYLPTIRKNTNARIFLRPQNVENRVWMRYLEKLSNPFKKWYLKTAANRLKQFETQVANSVDGIIAIAPHDAGIFQKYALKTPVITIPPGFDFSALGGYDIERQYRNFPSFYHLGSMDWPPNQQGIEWFISEVIPAVVEQYPDFVFKIAGKNMPERLIRASGRHLVVEGEIADALQYHEDKSVMIVPLLSGGGVRVKIIEAMALGKTVISTSIGAEGIPWTNGVNILIADTPSAFAQLIHQCAKSPALCREIGNNARQLALRHYDRKATAAQMVKFWEEMI